MEYDYYDNDQSKCQDRPYVLMVYFKTKSLIKEKSAIYLIRWSKHIVDEKRKSSRKEKEMWDILTRAFKIEG